MARSCFTATLTAALLLAVARPVAAPAEGTTDPKLLEKAKEAHRRIIAFDSHLDLPFDYPGASADGKTQFDLPKVARGQLKGGALAVFVPQGPRTPQGYAQARADAEKKYNLIKAVAEQNPNLAALAYSPADVRLIAEQGRFAVVMSLLNAYPLGADLSQIDEWYRRGVRIFGYTHAGYNQWADSSRPNQALGDGAQEHGGLSDLGKQGIARLNELGMLIDVSQLSTVLNMPDMQKVRLALFGHYKSEAAIIVKANYFTFEPHIETPYVYIFIKSFLLTAMRSHTSAVNLPDTV
jgi:membrane dipeptidase